MDYLLDILSDSRQVTSRRMFGEYCVYYAGRPVGLVCDDQLFLKRTETGKRLMKRDDEGAPFPGARPHLLITADDWDDRQWMNALVRATFESLPPPKLSKTRKASAAGKGAKAADIADLPNLGPKSQDMLAAAQIMTVTQLRKLGAVAAYARVKQKNASASLNLLWALEGALTDLPWQVVAREHRTSLLLALEQQQALQPAAPQRKKKMKAT
jgi:DNA transformation protein